MHRRRISLIDAGLPLRIRTCYSIIFIVTSLLYANVPSMLTDIGDIYLKGLYEGRSRAKKVMGCK